MRAFPQDTLYTKTGGVVNAKVVEINQNEIKYKKASNPDGPIYVMDVSNLVLIHFKNGSKEVFQSGNSDNQTVADNSNQNNTSNNPPTVINNYSSYNSGYGYPRPGFNVIVGTPFFRYSPWWAWGGYGYYRPYYHNYYWHGNYGWHGGGHNYGHYGHHGHH